MADKLKIILAPAVFWAQNTAAQCFGQGCGGLPDPEPISLKDLLYSMGLNFFTFMAIILGLVLFQIVGYRWYMKHAGPKKRALVAFAPLLAFMVWISIIIGVIAGSRFIY